jgi:hypothetical protein
VVLPLESRAEVDEARKALGLSSLSEYLDLAGRYLYQGKRIIVTDGETVEPAAPAGAGSARAKAKEAHSRQYGLVTK